MEKVSKSEIQSYYMAQASDTTMDTMLKTAGRLRFIIIVVCIVKNNLSFNLQSVEPNLQEYISLFFWWIPLIQAFNLSVNEQAYCELKHSVSAWQTVIKVTRLGLAIWQFWQMPDGLSHLVVCKATSNVGKRKRCGIKNSTCLMQLGWCW